MNYLCIKPYTSPYDTTYSVGTIYKKEGRYDKNYIKLLIKNKKVIYGVVPNEDITRYFKEL